jgi:hypothetical protein
LTSVPAQGCGCVVVVVGGDVVVVDDVVLVVVDVVLDVVVDDGTGSSVVVVVVVVEFVPPVTGRPVVDVVLDVLLDVLLDVVVLDELTGGGSLDGTQRPNGGEKKSKKRPGAFAERAAKHTRSPAVAFVGCGLDGTHTSHGSSTRTVRWSFTVTGTGGANCTELDDG